MVTPKFIVMTLDKDLSAYNYNEKIDLDRWISKRISENSPAVEMYTFLINNGTYFKIPSEVPDILLPQKTMAYHCHSNCTHYLSTVKEEKPILLDKIHFVTGLYGCIANNACVPPEKRYFIDHHSFILYNGAVIDWTVLNHPPKYYDVDQYFGVMFSPKIVLDAIDELELRNLNGPMVPLMILKDKFNQI